MAPMLLRLSPRERALIGQRIGEYRVGDLIGTGTTSAVSSFVVKPSFRATGASLTGTMLRLTVATAESSSPSFAW